MSKDQSIKVDWIPTATPEMPFRRAELPDQATILSEEPTNNGKKAGKKGPMSFISMAKNGKWPVYG